MKLRIAIAILAIATVVAAFSIGRSVGQSEGALEGYSEGLKTSEPYRIRAEEWRERAFIILDLATAIAETQQLQAKPVESKPCPQCTTSSVLPIGTASDPRVITQWIQTYSWGNRALSESQ